MGGVDKAILQSIVEKSRALVNQEIGEIPIGKILPDTNFPDGEDEIWYFRGATGRDSDRIMSHASTGNHFAASCAAIHLRCCTQDGQQRLFTPAQAEVIANFSLSVVSSIIAYMGGYESVMSQASPNVPEIEKNSVSTHKVKQ